MAAAVTKKKKKKGMSMKFQFNVLTIYLSFLFQEKPQVQEPESYATLRKLQNLEKKQKEEIDR